jgi:hypothetical protein
MKFFTFVFAIMSIMGFTICRSTDSQKPYNVHETIAAICDRSEYISEFITQATILDVMRAIELLVEKGASVTESDKVNKVIKEFIEELEKEYAIRVVEVEKNENFFKNVGFLGFIATSVLAIFCSYDQIPHVSNEFLERQLHAKETQLGVLMGISPVLFYLFYRAQGYQNERIALQEVEECIARLKEALKI